MSVSLPRARHKFLGGTPNQQYGLLVQKLAWVVFDTAEFLQWKNSSAEHRRRRRDEIWARFVAMRDNPVTTSSVFDRLRICFDEREIAVLRQAGALKRQARPSWGGPWGRPWDRPLPERLALVKALAGVE